MGRLVLTHSSYIEGLIEWGKNIADNKMIKTVTPGVIGRTRGKSTKFKIRITRKIDSGYKLVARKGNSYQEIYVITKVDYDVLQKLIAQ
tara:strand:- start:204 stop:470 length:267 start_codon:yes stop_codon:yes gene_type:complete